MQNNPSTVAERLQTIIDNHGWSTAQLAVELECSDCTIRRHLKNKAKSLQPVRLKLLTRLEEKLSQTA